MLFRVILLEMLLCVACVLLVLGHGVFAECFEKWSRPLLDTGTLELSDTLQQGGSAAGSFETVKSLPRSLQIRVFSGLMPALSPDHQQRLTAVAREIGLVAHGERLCRRASWWDRLHGVRLLTVVGGGEGIVPTLLSDRRLEVRAQAASWAATHPSKKVIERLLELLPDPTGLTRFSVQDSLLRIGAAIEGPLAEFLARNSGASVKAALEVAAGFPDARFLPAALVHAKDADAEIRSRAAALLGALGGSEATAALLDLLNDPVAEVRAETARVLGKLAHWPAAPRLATLLRDRAWIVRREAALGLRALGAPGILLLRKYTSDTDRFAADMARQILDLPESVGA